MSKNTSALRNEFKMFKDAFEQFQAVLDTCSREDFDLKELKETYACGQIRCVGRTKQVKALPPDAYLFSDEVRLSAFAAQTVREARRQEHRTGTNPLPDDTWDALLNSTADVCDKLTDKKLCPFVDDCIMTICEAVFSQLGTHKIRVPDDVRKMVVDELVYCDEIVY